MIWQGVAVEVLTQHKHKSTSARLKQMINNTADPGDRATKMRSLVENIKMQNLFFFKESTYILIYV